MVVRSVTVPAKSTEELRIFVERLMHFMNLWRVYNDHLSGKYVPSSSAVSEEWSVTDMGTTLMFVLYAFFYSLIEDSDDGLNGFRVWREHFAEEETAIAALESEVLSFRNDLKLFRNRLGFHGSRSRAHEARGLELFEKHSGTQIWEAMKNFKSLGAALLAKDLARKGKKDLAPEHVRRWIDGIVERSANIGKP